MIKKKTKKWLSRLGAGMLLGLSIFNLGSAFGQSNPSIPKGAGNFRRKEETNFNPELKEMMTMVEEEASSVISQQGKVYKNPEIQQLNLGQTLIRYGVMTAWVISAGVIFTSLIFNLPFALGRGVLSALPGNAHLAVLKLISEEKEIALGEKVNLNLVLDSNEKVSSAKVFLEFPREYFFLEKIDSQFSNQINFNSDGMEVIFDDLSGKEFSFKDSLARISFSLNDDVVWSEELLKKTKIKLIWEKSLVLNLEDNKEERKNVLGKTVNPQFSLNFGSMPKIFCQKTTEKPEGEKFWQEWMIGSPSNKEAKKWNQINENWSLGCVADETTVGFLFVGNQKIQKVIWENENGQKKNFSIIQSWGNEEKEFQAIILEKKDIVELDDNWRITLVGTDSNFSWPEKGRGKIVVD